MPRFRAPFVTVAVVLFPLLATTGCETYARLAALADTAEEHEEATVHCDRREVTRGSTPQAFCQVLQNTRGAPEFKRDCSDDFGATSGDGECPQEDRIGGCEIHGDHEDGSIAIDWFYAMPYGEDDDADRVPSSDRVRTRADVKALCAKRDRYESGATFVE